MNNFDKTKAKELLETTTTQSHLFQHALAVSSAMGAMAKHFGEDSDYWEAIGLLHDYDYEKYPEEHLQHTKTPLEEVGLDEKTIRAILSHGFGRCTDVKPESNLEKSLFIMDALSGLVSATAKMRPQGIMDLTPSSVNKKFKDKKFAAGVDREVISEGLEMLGMERSEVISICIEGMKTQAEALGLMGSEKVF